MAVKAQPSSATEFQAKLLALMLLLLAWKAEAANPVTCTAVTTRYNTTVVCDFGLDISESQHGFNVQFYDPDNAAQAKTVLACNFIEGGDLVCHEGSGIKFNKTQVSDQIQIIGPPAVDKVGGRYACQLAPAEGRIETCYLKYRDIPMDPPTTSKIHTPGNDSINSTSLIVYLLKIIVGLLIAIFIFMIVVYIIRGVLYCKRERNRGSGSPRPPQGDTEALERNGSRDTQNTLSIPFFSWCGRFRGDESQGQEGVSTIDGSDTDPQKEQTKKKDKEDPAWEAIPMESASVESQMLHYPSSSTNTDPQTEQRNTKDKEDPDQKANEMESVSAENPLLRGPPSSTDKNEEAAKERPGGQKKRFLLRFKLPFIKKNDDEDQQQKVPEAEPQGGKKIGYKEPK